MSATTRTSSPGGSTDPAALPGDDRRMLAEIRAYCLSRAQAAPDAWPTPEARARQRAYAAVASAAGALLEEMDGGGKGRG
jgi:hypothetical protein